MSNEIAERAIAPVSLVSKFAARYSVEPAKMLSTLKQTAFRVRDGEVTNEQMMALLIVADQYRLNPFTKEIYAFPDKNNGIVPVVGVDGWARIINEHPQFDGMDFAEAPIKDAEVPAWIECTIYRKDRAHPIKVREFLVECKRDVQPWKSHPRRMLRHKAMIQCARIAFGFVGVYDEDEAARIVDMGAVDATPSRNQPTAVQQAGLPALAEDRFDRQKAAWQAQVESGTAPADLIAMLSTRYALSDDQKAAIRNLAPLETTE
jgi:phage recombination protein Bet